MTKRFMTVDEAAAYLCISRRLLYDRISAGDIPSLKVGWRRLVPLDDLDAWVREQVERQTKR